MYELEMLGMFSPPPWVSDPDMHNNTCMTHMPWCMPGSLTNGFLWSWWRENIPGIPSVCATRNFTYLHYCDIIMGTMASQITSLTIVYSTDSLVTGEFPAQRASNAENVSIWWRHHVVIGPWAEGRGGRRHLMGKPIKYEGHNDVNGLFMFFKPWSNGTWTAS